MRRQQQKQRRQQADVESAWAHSVRTFLRPSSAVDRSDTVSSDRNKTLGPRATDDTVPIIVPYGAGIWTFARGFGDVFGDSSRRDKEHDRASRKCWRESSVQSPLPSSIAAGVDVQRPGKVLPALRRASRKVRHSWRRNSGPRLAARANDINLSLSEGPL